MQKLPIRIMNDEDINQREDELFTDIILLGKCQEV